MTNKELSDLRKKIYRISDDPIFSDDTRNMAATIACEIGKQISQPIGKSMNGTVAALELVKGNNGKHHRLVTIRFDENVPYFLGDPVIVTERNKIQ